MSKIVSRVLAFLPSPSAGIAGYTLYWGPSNDGGGNDTVLNNNPQNGTVSDHVDIGIPPMQVIDEVEYHVVALETIPAVAALAEGEYDFGVAPRDGVGNESDITEAEDVTLDITPPEKVPEVKVLSAP